MKKSIKIISCVFLSLPLMAYSVTPLELKAMQTRKFNKNPDELISGIKSFCEDSGAQHTVPSSAASLTPAELSRPGANSSGMKVTGLICMFNPKIKMGLFGVKDENKYSQIKVDLLKHEGSESVIRIRLYSGFPAEQVTNAAQYSEIFKSIGDAMFIQAIPLEAMQQE